VRQRGFTLIETLIVAAIVMTMAALVVAAFQNSRPFGMRSAVNQFDASVAYARAVAAGSGNGATIVFVPRRDVQGLLLPGFNAQIYSGRPNSLGPIAKVPVGTFSSTGDISEAALGKPPFSLFFNGAGHASGARGVVTANTTMPADPGCPTPPRMRFSFGTGAVTDTRTLPCVQALAGPAAAPSPL